MDPRFITPANRSYEAAAAQNIDFIDFISVLKEFNRHRMMVDRVLPGTLPFITLTTSTVELFFNICSTFQMPPDVKYIALEIFDRFMACHFTTLWEVAHNSTTDCKTQKKNWVRLSSRAQKQALLRVIGSIQIASKFVLQSTALTLKHVHKYLIQCGHAYSLDSVYHSEIRIFSMIGCKVPLYSIYDFTTTLLEGLKNWTDVKRLLPTCEKVLSFIFLQRDEIYLRYFWMGTGRWDRNRQERLQFAAVELDNFLMASAVLVSSLYIHRTEDLGPNKASVILSELGSINSNDVRALAVIVTQTVLGSRAVSFTSCG